MHTSYTTVLLLVVIFLFTLAAAALLGTLSKPKGISKDIDTRSLIKDRDNIKLQIAETKRDTFLRTQERFGTTGLSYVDPNYNKKLKENDKIERQLMAQYAMLQKEILSRKRAENVTSFLTGLENDVRQADTMPVPTSVALGIRDPMTTMTARDWEIVNSHKVNSPLVVIPEEEHFTLKKETKADRVKRFATAVHTPEHGKRQTFVSFRRTRKRR